MKPIIPDAALGQHVALIGMTGSGKSYLTRGLVEHLLDQSRRVCIIDYTGVWYGLRSSQTGKKAAYPVVIFGGEHGDVPLNEHAGPALAKIVAAGNRPCIVDLDGMTIGAQQRFLTAFLEELYRLNSKPLHLIMEEVDEYAPQTGAPGAERMIGAVCRIFQRGRRKGFRAMAITQRPANVHKRVLTQCKTLIALQLNAPQDRGAVLDWIRGHADLDAGKRVVDDLPKLQLGQAYVWAPGHGILDKVHVPAIRTFDSMRAPEEGEDAEPASWAEIDLDDVKGALADAVKDAEANDPKLLRAEIARLKAEIAKRPTEKALAIDQDAVRAAEARGYERGVDAARARAAGELEKAAQAISEHNATVARGSTGLASAQLRLHAAVEAWREKPKAEPVRARAALGPSTAETPSRAARGNGSGEPLPKVERAFLTVLAQQARPLTRNQVAIFAGYSAASRHVDNTLAALRSKEYVIGSGNAIELTDAGRHALGDYAPLPTGAELRSYWMRELDKAASSFLGVICEAYPGTLTRDEVAEQAGYSPQSRHVDNTLAQLRSRDLVTGSGRAIKASEELFE